MQIRLITNHAFSQQTIQKCKQLKADNVDIKSVHNLCLQNSGAGFMNRRSGGKLNLWIVT